MVSIQSNEQGFTLLEILIALTIFAIGLLGIAGLQITAIRQNSGANTFSIATALAQGAVEEVLTMSDENAIFQSNNPNMAWDLDPLTAATTVSVPGGGTYSATWSVLTDTPVTDIARVTVTVLGPPRNPGDGPRSTSLTCYKRFIGP